MLVAGAYTEITPTGQQAHQAPAVLVHQAEDLHRIVLHDGPCWTVFSAGPVRRRWGFQTDQGWVYWRTYLAGLERSANRSAAMPQSQAW